MNLRCAHDDDDDDTNTNTNNNNIDYNDNNNELEGLLMLCTLPCRVKCTSPAR
jgi:hypothetical protein